MKYLVIVPARGGSKRIPRKNLALIGKKPLISYTLQAIKESIKLKKDAYVLVSTDDQEIANLCSKNGFQVPFLRPKKFAQDNSSIMDAIDYNLKRLQREGATFDNLILLASTSPFRSAKQIDEAIAKYEASRAETLVSVKELTDHPYWAWKIKGKWLKPYYSLKKMAFTRRQVPPLVIENGAIVISKVSIFKKTKNIYGKKVVSYLMDAFSSLDIDTKTDLDIANFLIKAKP